MPQAMQSGLDKQIARELRGLEERVSRFRLEVRVEVATGQILGGKLQEE